MNIEIFKVAYLCYLIMGIAFALFSVIVKSDSDKDKKVRKILWVIGCVMAGCAGAVLTFYIMQGVLAIIISFILVTLAIAIITLIIGSIIRKIQKRRTKT